MKTFEILLVEDNEADAYLMQEVFQECSYQNKVNVVADGLEAMNYLYRQGKHNNASRPDLILLDLNLPKKDGREVLEEVKRDPTLCTIPVIVLTTSESEEDIRKCYQFQANCYITKPMQLERTYEVVQGIEDFWFGLVRLPKTEE